MAAFTLPAKAFSSRDRSRIDILGTEESVEGKSIYLFEKLKSGEITVGDLMGPLCHVPSLSPEIFIPPGEKNYFPSAPNADFLPKGGFNEELESQIHPPDYVNPQPSESYDLIAIGGGVSGLISVIMGAWLGKKCALIERHGMGGDCLNTGCVPSKAVIACARAFHSIKSLGEFGISIPEGSNPTIDFGFVMRRMRAIRAKISHHDSVQRYSREFCEHVFIGQAEFAGGHVIKVTGDDGTSRSLTFKKAMIATGASAAIPPVPGLRECPHLTNSNFFNLEELPPRMVVIGCGPIGLELSQSMARFGSRVICLEVFIIFSAKWIRKL